MPHVGGSASKPGTTAFHRPVQLHVELFSPHRSLGRLAPVSAGFTLAPATLQVPFGIPVGFIPAVELAAHLGGIIEPVAEAPSTSEVAGMIGPVEDAAQAGGSGAAEVEHVPFAEVARLTYHVEALPHVVLRSFKGVGPCIAQFHVDLGPFPVSDYRHSVTIAPAP